MVSTNNESAISQMIKKIELSISESYSHSSENKTRAKGGFRAGGIIRLRLMRSLRYVGNSRQGGLFMPVYLFFMQKIMQRTNLILLILLGLSSTRVNCQIWQHTYGVQSHYEICTSVVKGDYNGFTMGISRDSRAMWIVKADINGNILWDKSLYDIVNNTFIIHSVDIDNSQNIYISGGVYPGDSMLCALLKLNNCGELEWCKKISMGNSNFGLFAKVTSSSNIRLLTYGASEYSVIDRFQLWEIDPEGNIIWMKQVLPGTQTYFQNTEFTQMCLTSDGGSLMAGYTYYPYDTTNNPYDAVLQPCLVKCDSQGDMQWVYPPLSGADTTKLGFFTSCTQIGNTYYAAGSHYQLGTEFFLRPLVARFDLNGNLLSYNYTPADTMYHELTQIVSATDTSLLLISAANTVFTDPNYLMVFIADTMGNLQKSFTRTDLVVGQFGDEVAKMRDNKFIIPCQSPLGWPGPLTDVVAIKLNANLEYDSVYTQPFTYDSLCPYPIVSDTILCNCEPFVGLDKSVAISKTAMLGISPNPATGKFVVKTENMPNAIGRLQVFSVWGKQLTQLDIPAGDKEITVHCEGWVSGLYLVRVEKGGMVVSGKVVIR